MASTVQIIVAGALLLAWIWVLGRPVIPGPRTGSDNGDLDPGASRRAVGRGASGDRPVTIAAPAFIRDRLQLPVVQRRRQRVLATMFATFVSFFLAVAFRGTFVYLLGLMAIALAVHLGIAARVGARIEAEKRAARAADARKRPRADPGLIARGTVIDADGVGEAGDAGRVGDSGYDGTSAFGRAAELASALDSQAERHGARDARALVSDLIEQAWAEPGPEAERSVAVRGFRARAVRRARRAAGGGRGEVIFTRPVGESRSRWRRGRAKPVQAGAEVDGDVPTAVNQR